ncbi:MAG: hypothetical protein ABI467_05490 [Kofleriaceae bacterium]
MIVGSVAMMFVAARERDKPAPRVHVRAPERPWLSREAADQIVGAGGTIGPLFAGIELGGSAPTPADRARIAAFARAHDVEIRFEIEHHELTAIRFAVTFGGCCGYEGADGLAARLGRTQLRCECMCGDRVSGMWFNNWALVTEDGTYMRGRVEVNRVELRWEAAATLDDLLERAVAMVGAERGHARSLAGDRWSSTETSWWTPSDARVEVPFVGAPRDGRPVGFDLTFDRGHVAGVGLELEALDSDARTPFEAALRKRWGKPRIDDAGEHWTRFEHGRPIVATLDFLGLTIRVDRNANG